jgi:hypothetical protein
VRACVHQHNIHVPSQASGTAADLRCTDSASASSKQVESSRNTGTESKSDGGSCYLRTMRIAQRQCIVSISIYVYVYVYVYVSVYVYVYVYVSPSEEYMYSERS